MEKTTHYLENNQIKPNLTRQELLNLKRLLENAEANRKELGTRTKECYL